MRSRSWFLLATLFYLFAILPEQCAASAVEIYYNTVADDTDQPAMYFTPENETPVPLIVALHTWSGDYRQQYHKEIEDWCIEQGWVYIHPNFRGPNNRPEATGSDLVVEDIVSAVEFVKANRAIDPKRIFLVGTSGGGYTALLMAGRRPDIWAGVSAWVPISDLAAWHEECLARNLNYYEDIEASCGGRPGESLLIDAEYKKRSPLTYIAQAKNVRLHIHAGINDGHTGSVPISHAIHAFNILADMGDRIAAEDIQFMLSNAKVPEHLIIKKGEVNIESYGDKQPLLIRTSGKTTLIIFDGGHEYIPSAVLDWIQHVR